MAKLIDDLKTLDEYVIEPGVNPKQVKDLIDGDIRTSNPVFIKAAIEHIHNNPTESNLRWAIENLHDYSDTLALQHELGQEAIASVALKAIKYLYKTTRVNAKLGYRFAKRTYNNLGWQSKTALGFLSTTVIEGSIASVFNDNTKITLGVGTAYRTDAAKKIRASLPDDHIFDYDNAAWVTVNSVLEPADIITNLEVQKEIFTQMAKALASADSVAYQPDKMGSWLGSFTNKGPEDSYATGIMHDYMSVLVFKEDKPITDEESDPILTYTVKEVRADGSGTFKDSRLPQFKEMQQILSTGDNLNKAMIKFAEKILKHMKNLDKSVKKISKEANKKNGKYTSAELQHAEQVYDIANQLYMTTVQSTNNCLKNTSNYIVACLRELNKYSKNAKKDS